MFQKLMLKSTICIPPVWKSYDRSQFGRFLTFVSDSILMKSLRITNSLSVFVSGVSLMRLAEELKQHDWLAFSGSRTKYCVTYFSGKFCNIGHSTCFSYLF